MPDEVAFEAIDQRVAPLDHRRFRQVVYPGDEDVLVMRAIEDADLALLRQPFADPPQEAVPPFFRGRRLERGDPDALGVEAADDVGDRAVLAAGVHALQHQQHGVLRRGVAHLL